MTFKRGVSIVDSKKAATEVPPGSHLIVRFGPYLHHGIASKDGSVVHFGRGIFDAQNAGVAEVAVDIFSQGKPILIVDSKSSFSSAEIVVRAQSRIGEHDYDLFDNNCEHFANWCRSGQNESHQVNLSETMIRQLATLWTRPWIRKLAFNMVSKATPTRVTGVAARYLARGPAVVAGVADAVQTTVEIMAAKQGKTKDERRRIGRQAAIATSVAMGWIVGGPVTAAAGTGIWFFSQVAAIQAVETGKQVAGLTLRQMGQVTSERSG